MFFKSIFATTALAVRVFAGECEPCPPIPAGDIMFNNQHQLYPAYFAWDETRCLLYVSAIFNATVAAWDPYKSELVSTISVPGLSHPANVQSDKRLPGLALNADSSVLSFVVQASAYFLSAGADVSGDNFLIQWDLNNNALLAETNLTATSNGEYGAFLDVTQGGPEQDYAWYVVGFYTSSLLRVEAARTPQQSLAAAEYYVPRPFPQPRVFGYGGLRIRDNILYTQDNPNSQLVKIDMLASPPTPIIIPQNPAHSFSSATALEFPSRYNDTVLLMAEDVFSATGSTCGVAVFRSADDWDTAEYLGFIVAKERAETPATTLVSQIQAKQIQDRIFASVIYYENPVDITAAGNRSDFALTDITDKVDALVYG